MFKGLKSKIAEETKRIQEAVVTQVGEGFNNLTSSNKRLNELSETPKNSPNRNPSQDNLSLIDVSLSDVDRNYSRQSSSVSDSFISAASSSSFMQEADGELTPTRQRHDSFSSVGSVESFFPAVPTPSRLAPIPSDIETDVESVAGSSSFVSGASKEQISSVLTKLQGRAANYKDKYRHLLLSYKEMSKENEKIRSVLTTSQDKALRRIQELKEERKLDEKAKREMEESLRHKLLAQDGTIATLRHQVQLLKDGKPADDDVLNEVSINHTPTAIFAEREKVKKLEELLNRCKESIKSYKEKIQTLGNENQELKKKVQEINQEHKGNEEISDFVTQRAVDEWKMKLKTAEESWNKKLLEESESNALNVAQIKQEMHSEIEKKDQTIEELRQLIKTADKNVQETKENFQKELEKAKETEKNLEEEKKNLIQEVSRSKQAALQIVKDEDEKKREQIHKQFEQNMIEKTMEFEKKIQEIRDDGDRRVAEIEKRYETKMKENEEQMNLAIEERDLQKMAALSQHDERLDMLQDEILKLKTENMRLESVLDSLRQEKRQMSNESTKILNDKETLVNEKTSLENQLDELRKEFAASRDEFRSILDENEKFKTDLTRKNDELRRVTDLIEGSTNDNKEINENLKNLENSLRIKEDDLTQLRTKFDVVSNDLTTVSGELIDVKKEYQTKVLRCEFMEKELKRVLDEKRLIEDDFKKRLEQLMQSKSCELEEFRKQLDDLKNMEIEKISAEFERAKLEFHEKESSLKQELQQKSDEILFSRDTVGQKDEALTNLRRELDEKSAEFSSLFTENEKLRQEIRSLNESNGQLEASVRDSDSLRREISSLQMDLEQARTYVKNLEQEKIFITEEKNIQIRESNDVLGALEDAVELYRKQFNEQLKENEQNKLSTKFETVENESRLNEFRSRISDLEEAVDVYKSRDVEKNSLVVEKNVEIQNLREKLQNIIRDGFFYSSEKDFRIKELLEKLDESDRAVEDFRNENVVLKTQLNTIRENSEKQNEEKKISLENSLIDLESKLSAKENELKSIRTSAELNKNELSFIFGAFVDCFGRSDVRDSLEKYSNLIRNDEISTSDEKTSDAKNELIRSLREFTMNSSTNENELKKFRMERDELEEKLKNVENLMFQMKTAFETNDVERKKCLETFETASKEKQTLIDELNSELDRTKKTAATFESQLKSLTVENDHREELIKNLEKTMKTLSDDKNLEITRLRQTFDAVNDEISTKNQEILTLKRQISKSEESVQRSIEENKNLNKKLKEIKIYEEKSSALDTELADANENLEKIRKELTAVNNELKTSKNEAEILRQKIATTEQEAKAANEILAAEKEKFNAECDARVADYKKKAETKLSQIKKLLENDKEVLSQRVVELEAELMAKSNEFLLLRERNESDSNSSAEKIASTIADVERRCEEEKNSTLKIVRDEYETKIRTIVDDHNDRVKQLAKDFQAELTKKETEWQEELSSAYNKTDEDRQRVTKEYQKEMKQLYKDLQEKSQTNDEFKSAMEKEKMDEIQSVKDEYEKILKEKEEQFKNSLKQILDDQEKQHKQEIEGLTNEWNADRRHVLSSNNVKKNSDDVELKFGTYHSQNLEHQAQIAQGDVQIESPMYLKQRVKQLESQLEIYKDKQKRDADHSTKNNSLNSAADVNHQNSERLSSVSLDYTNPVFCEPTEAEYLRNIVFRYMVERESLGKESVTLAKAIAAVLKLSLDQTKEVLSKEEARLSAWFG